MDLEFPGAKREGGQVAGRVLPAGSVTLLFTDIEGSTRLMEELGEEEYVDMTPEEIFAFTMPA